MDKPVHISQIDLIAKIGLWIAREYKVKNVTARQYNAIVKGVNLIVEEFAVPFKAAPPGCGLHVWSDSDEVGASSKYMLHVMRYGVSPNFDVHHPHDPDDFRRCVVLLRAVPELRNGLQNLKGSPAPWPALVDNWDELESLLDEELPSGRCPKLYARMRELIGSKEGAGGVIDAAQDAGKESCPTDRSGSADEAHHGSTAG